MTFPDDPQLTNIERALPELAALRELSSAERPHPTVRRALKTRVRQTLQGANTRRSARAVSPRTFLLAAAIVVAVPGALAATDAGRGWLERGAALLPWYAANSSATDAGTGSVINSVFKGAAKDAPNPQAARDLATEPNPSARASLPTTSMTFGMHETSASKSGSFNPTQPALPTQVTSATSHGSAAAASNTRAIAPPQLQAERRLLESARLALARADYDTARHWCDEHRTRFATPILGQERTALEALIATGETATAGRGSEPK